MKVLYSFVLLINFYIIGAWAECNLTVRDDFGTNSPLLITNGHFVYPPKGDGVSLTFAHNQEQEGFCPGSFVKVLGIHTGGNAIRLTCSSDSKFMAPTTVREFSNIRCDKDPDFSTREIGHCRNGQLIEIGFEITRNQFVCTIRLCYNRYRGRTHWAHSVVPGAISGRQTVGATPAFKVGREGYFNEVGNVAAAYTRESQRQMVFDIFDRNASLRDKYVSATGEHYLVRSHLVPRADMFYTAQQYSTFYYLNVQPMYQSVNNGNWKLVENIVRFHATHIGDLDVWTGNFNLNLDLLYAPHDYRPIYLASKGGSPVLFVPRLFFKLVYSRSTNQAIVYVTANNPFLHSSDLPHDYRVCPEHMACRHHNPQFNNVDKGLTYCCLYNHFIEHELVSKLGLPSLPSNVSSLV